MNRSELPIDPFLPSIVESLKSQSSVIILAEPGAGKSTRVPVELIKQGTWLMLQPRRWAAKLVAHRIAQENNFKLGNEIGYQVRFENRTSAQSRLIVMTEGILLRKILQDSELSGIKGVILDEFHERSLDLDLALALLKELQESLREDLKIVVMSATLDPAALLKYLPNSKLFNIPGRTFPVQKKYLGNLSVARALPNILAEQDSGDGLIFLPGAYEIERAIREAEDQIPGVSKNFELLPLYSSLTEREQTRVFQDSPRRKIVFSTNIAETSITLPKIKWVLDSGLAKVMRNDPQLGQDRLELLRISRASSEQRAGRAGRVSAGTCYRLWSAEEDTQLRAQETPEVHRVNLSSHFLFLAAYGVLDPMKLDWFERPRSSAVQFALEELEELNFLVAGKLTDEGRKAALLPLPPLFAKLKLVGERLGALDFSARLAAFLESSKSGEKIKDWDALIRNLNRLNERDLRAAAQIAGRETKTVSASQHELFEKVLIESMPMRVFVQDKKVGRRTVRAYDRQHVLPQAGVILNSNERDEKGSPVILVQDYVPIEMESLRAFAQKKRMVSWDAQSEKVRAREGNYFIDLALGTETDAPVKAEEAEHMLSEIISKDPLKFFGADPSFVQWFQRLQLWNAHRSETFEIPWDELAQAASVGKTKLNQVLEFPWKGYLESMHPELAQLEKDLPERIQVPTGNSIKIDYESNPPKLSVRLQEVFGWTETPKIMNGKISLLIELLSPGYKPIQLTRDLKSFWSNAYFEVKKELKARYPKHAWPDEPLTAKPEAKGRRRF